MNRAPDLSFIVDGAPTPNECPLCCSYASFSCMFVTLFVMRARLHRGCRFGKKHYECRGSEIK